MDPVIAEIVLVRDIRHDLVFVETVCEIDDTGESAFLNVDPRFQNSLELIDLVCAHLIKPSGKVVQLLQAGELTEQILQTVDIGIIIGNKDFFIRYSEIIRMADLNPIQDRFHFISRYREGNPFPDKFTLVVLAQIGNIGFQFIIIHPRPPAAYNHRRRTHHHSSDRASSGSLKPSI